MKKFSIILIMMIILSVNLYVLGQDHDELIKKAEEAMTSGNYESALEYLQKGANEHPEYYYYMGIVYQKMGNIKSAVLCYKEAANQCPDKAQLCLIAIAQCEEASNNQSAAFSDYKKAVSMIPEYQDIDSINIGKATDGKIAAYESLKDFHPKDPEILKKLVYLYKDKGMYAQGIATLKYILKENKK